MFLHEVVTITQKALVKKMRQVYVYEWSKKYNNTVVEHAFHAKI